MIRNSTYRKNGPPKWKTKNDGYTNTVDGEKIFWCEKYLKEGKYNGLYIPPPHDQEKWLKKVKQRHTDQKKRIDNKDNEKLAAKSS